MHSDWQRGRGAVGAAQPWLAQRGTLVSPQQRAAHNCLGYFSASQGRSTHWSCIRNGQEYVHEPGGTLLLGNPGALIDLAADGAGIVSMMEAAVAPAIRG